MDNSGQPDGWDGPPTRDEETRRRLDNFLTLLSNQRRRDVLYHLTSTELTDAETLAETLAALEEERPIDQISSADREKVHTELVHIHLPKLSDAGAIEFDPRSKVIRCQELPEMLEIVMETCVDIEAEGSAAG